MLRFFLQLDNNSHIGKKELELINWLRVSERFNQYICSNASKFFNESCPLYFAGNMAKGRISKQR